MNVEMRRSKKMARESRLHASSEAEYQSDLVVSSDNTDREMAMGKMKGRG